MPTPKKAVKGEQRLAQIEKDLGLLIDAVIALRQRLPPHLDPVVLAGLQCRPKSTATQLAGRRC